MRQCGAKESHARVVEDGLLVCVSPTLEVDLRQRWVIGLDAQDCLLEGWRELVQVAIEAD